MCKSSSELRGTPVPWVGGVAKGFEPFATEMVVHESHVGTDALSVVAKKVSVLDVSAMVADRIGARSHHGGTKSMLRPHTGVVEQGLLAASIGDS